MSETRYNLVGRVCRLLGVSKNSNDWFILNKGLIHAGYTSLVVLYKHLKKGSKNADIIG